MKASIFLIDFGKNFLNTYPFTMKHSSFDASRRDDFNGIFKKNRTFFSPKLPPKYTENVSVFAGNVVWVNSGNVAGEISGQNTTNLEKKMFYGKHPKNIY